MDPKSLPLLDDTVIMMDRFRYLLLAYMITGQHGKRVKHSMSTCGVCSWITMKVWGPDEALEQHWWHICCAQRLCHYKL